MHHPVRNDLLAGTVYGTSLSLALWTVALHPPRLEWFGPLLLLSVFVAALPTRVPRLGRVDPTYAGGLAGALIGGPGTAIATLVTCAILRRAVFGRRGARPLAPWSFRLALSTTALAIGGGVAELLDPARGTLFLAVHGAGFLLASLGLTSLALRWAGRPRIARGAGSRIVGGLIAMMAGTALATLAIAPTDPFVGCAFAATGLIALRAAHATRRQRRQRRRSIETLFELRRQAALSLIGGEGPRSDEARAIERTCRAVGTRLRIRTADNEALGCAALLAHARRRRDRRRQPATLDELLFPHPISTIVTDAGEQWDGLGPRARRGRNIHPGARILGAVLAYDGWRRIDGLDEEEALGRLVQESGRRFAPGVVDALIDQIEADGDESRCAPALELLHAPPAAPPTQPTARRLDWAEHELDAFYDVARAAAAGLDLDACLTLIAARLTSLVPHTVLAVYRLDGGRQLRAVFSAGQGSATFARNVVPLGERLSGAVALERRAWIRGRDGEVEHDLVGHEHEAERAGLDACLAAPMVVGERVVGTLTVYDRPQRRFSTEDRRRLTRVAACVAELVERDHGAAEIPRAVTDPVTGLPNATWLTDAVVARAKRGGRFGVLGIRLRGVERVAARHGARAADRLLATAAGRVTDARRSDDTLARFGDDLFVILTEARSVDDLLAHAGRLVTALNELPERFDLPARIRPALAHACYPDDGADAESLLDALDERLADSAERGRAIVPFPCLVDGEQVASG